MSSQVSTAIRAEHDSAPWHAANLSVTVGADDGDEESEVDELRASLRAWNTIAGPSSFTVEEELDRQFPDAATQILSSQLGTPCDADFTSVLNDLFADGNRLFQPLADNNFVDEVFAEKKPKILNGYLFGDTIGEGSYGKVKEVLEEYSLVRRAVKIIKATRLRKIPNGRANVEQELKILQRVHHRNVIALRDVFRDERKQKLYMVMDYCTGSLQQMLDGSKEKKLPIFQAHHYFTQLTDGLSYLHAKGVIHNDIKPGNLLVTLDDTLKISDFGVAEMLDRFDRDDWCTIGQGTPKFQPPEIVSGTVARYHGRKVDIWACGVTLYNLVSGEYPFEGDIIMRLFENIATQPLQMPRSVQLSEPLRQLLSAMLEKDPEKRINMHDIRRCDWYKQKYLPDESLRVAVPVCNNMPAHRPLSVYAPLEQMYGGAMEEGTAIAITDEPMSGDTMRVITFPTEDEEMLPTSRDNGIVVPLNESKRNRSILSMCMGSSRSP